MMPEAIVECYAGYRYPERPRVFVWEGEREEVDAIERRWRTPAGPVFLVRTGDGRHFTLAYDEAAGTWDVQPVSGHGASQQP